MATYLVLPDDYAGWNPTGRNFALISAAVGSVSLLSWLSLHHHLGSLRPTAASDQLFLSALVWLGAGAFALLAVAALGSIQLSLKARGMVTITADGVTRTVKARAQFLAWSDIRGLVPMPYGGVTLVATSGKAHILIPRFLDDYRACIAEIKEHGIQRLPSSSLRQTRNNSWREILCISCAVIFFNLATGTHASHRVRIAGINLAIVFAVCVLRSDRAQSSETIPKWVNIAVFAAILLYGIYRIILNW